MRHLWVSASDELEDEPLWSLQHLAEKPMVNFGILIDDYMNSRDISEILKQEDQLMMSDSQVSVEVWGRDLVHGRRSLLYCPQSRDWRPSPSHQVARQSRITRKRVTEFEVVGSRTLRGRLIRIV